MIRRGSKGVGLRGEVELGVVETEQREKDGSSRQRETSRTAMEEGRTTRTTKSSTGWIRRETAACWPNSEGAGERPKTRRGTAKGRLGRWPSRTPWLSSLL